MIINLKVPDDLFEAYVRKYGIPRAWGVMKDHLEFMKDVSSGDRFYIVHGDERRELEAIIGTTAADAKQLIQQIKKLNMYKIGGKEIVFTDDELARISMQAKFHGRTIDQFIHEMATSIKDRMLENV